jgi:hypothetical protein
VILVRDQTARRIVHAGAFAGLIIVASFVSGCAKPSAANIELRKQNQALHQQIDTLQRRHEADAAVIRGLRSSIPTQPTLPPERLEHLFTTHGLRFGRLTGGADLDRSKPGDEGIKVYVVPIDQAGQPLKAAGSFVIEAFDLAAGDAPRVGRWTFDINQSAANWRGALMEYTYVLTCPLQKPPAHAQLTIRVTFIDALTQGSFTAEQVVKVNLP